jgi:hypothetical protein
MVNLNRRLWQTLGSGWLSFLIVGLAIYGLSVSPTTVVLIDRSYCPTPDWQQVVQQYKNLYQQHYRHQIHIKTVVLFSDLGEELFVSPPTPEIIQVLNTYGLTSSQRRQQLQATYSTTRLLGCHL